MVARSRVAKKQAGGKEKEALLKAQPQPCGYLLTTDRRGSLRVSTRANREECAMNSKLQIALIAVVGAAFGAAGMPALYAQATPKAYIVTELEVIDVEAQKVYSPLAQAAQKAAGGRNFRTAERSSLSRAKPPSAWPSPNGTAWTQRWHSATERPGTTLYRSVTRLSKSLDRTPSKLCHRRASVTATRGWRPYIFEAALARTIDALRSFRGQVRLATHSPFSALHTSVSFWFKNRRARRVAMTVSSGPQRT